MPIRFRFLLSGCFALLAACDQAPAPLATSAAVGAEFAGSRACIDCHQAQFSAWAGSHHELAMQAATADTVLGDFNNSTFDYFDTSTRFYTGADAFLVETENATGEQQEFKVVYVFGVEPLQQYLVQFPNGRLQALPFAWDTREAVTGGQRWFNLYPDEYIGPGDELHWTGREQNWNYMCAECHSTKLEMNYDIASNSFATTYAEINVGCEACHGPATRHISQAEQNQFGHNFGLEVDLDDRGRSHWEMNPATGIAERSELAMRPPQQPEACGRCHARRGVITSGYEYGKPLTDTHLPSLLEDTLYFADGQIQDEVYVYGSFLQSRMYLAGVTCSDCHDPHSLTLHTGAEPSAICSQCHLPSKFATAEHSHHESDQAACVDCHMQSRTYMGVDDRRDHSFRVPRPDISVSTDAPNACNSCHSDRDAAWAASAVADWTDGLNSSRASFAAALHAGRTGFANLELRAVIDDYQFPGIARATALSLLSGPVSQADAESIRNGLQDADPLVRIAALRALLLLPGELQLRLGVALLDDPVRGVRVEAASTLSSISGQLPAAARASYMAAADEYRLAQLAVASRPEAHANLGGFEARSGNFAAAIPHFEQSLRMEPAAAAIRVNLADVLRQQGDEANAEQQLRAGLEIDPGNAALHHSLGLLLIRTGKSDAGLEQLQTAAKLDPESSRYQYVVGVALNSLGRQDAAIETLTIARIRFATDYDIAWALATMLRDRGELDRAREIAAELARRHPDDRNVAALLESL